MIVTNSTLINLDYSKSLKQKNRSSQHQLNRECRNNGSASEMPSSATASC